VGINNRAYMALYYGINMINEFLIKLHNKLFNIDISPYDKLIHLNAGIFIMIKEGIYE